MYYNEVIKEKIMDAIKVLLPVLWGAIAIGYLIAGNIQLAIGFLIISYLSSIDGGVWK